MVSKIEVNLIFSKNTADPIKNSDNKVISKGSKCVRVHLKNPDIHIALESKKLFSSIPSLTWKDKLFGKKYVILKIEDSSQGKEGYIKVNKKSLEKRMGISTTALDKEIDSNKTLNVTRLVQHEILIKEWGPLISRNKNGFEEAPEELRNDSVFVIPFLEENGLLLKDTTDKVKKDWKPVLAAVGQNGLALQFANTSAFADDLSNRGSNFKDFWAKAIFTTAVEQNGMALQFTPPSIQDNEEIVRLAYKQNSASLQFASARVRALINP